MNRSIRMAVATSLLAGSGSLVGCVGYVEAPRPVYYAPAPQPVYVTPQPVYVQQAPVEDDGPVVQDPSVVLVDVEPPPYARVYVYDPGYPPGCYSYGGYYYYGRYRYPHNVFINRYVTVNVRQNRYIDRNVNIRQSRVIEAQHQVNYTRYGGRPPGGPAGHGPGGPGPGDHGHGSPHDDHR